RRDERYEQPDREQETRVARPYSLLSKTRREQESLVVAEFAEQRVDSIVRARDVLIAHRRCCWLEAALLSNGRDPLEVDQVGIEYRNERIGASLRDRRCARHRLQTRD